MANDKHSPKGKPKTKRKTSMKKQQNNSTRAWALHVALSIALLLSSQSLSPAYAPFTFGNTGSLTTARAPQTATLLSNGKVLVAGGYDEIGRASCRERVEISVVAVSLN